MVLSCEQKLEVLGLYFGGLHKYTEIAKFLSIPYKPINAFLNKWRDDRGMIKKRKPRKTVSNGESKELKMLRKFYNSHMSKDASATSH